MEQLSIIEELFTQIRQLKMIFSNEMAVCSSGRPIRIDPAEFVAILHGAYKAMTCIDLRLDGMDRDIQELGYLTSHLGTYEETALFSKSFLDIVDRALFEIVRCRECYCIIRRDDPIPGLASHIITNLGHIARSIFEGYIPVVDMVHAENGFTALSYTAGQNAWELFFRQTFDRSLPSDLSAQKIILKSGIPSVMPSYDMEFLTNPELVDRWRVMMRRYMPFSDAFQQKAELALQNKPFDTGERVLGVLCRGTDYIFTRPYNHPVQPTLEEVLEKTKEVMTEYDCKYIYLATEDPMILYGFGERFRDVLFVTQDIYYPDTQGCGLNEVNKRQGVDLYHKNEEYLLALYLLSRCQCFLGGRTSGTVVALLLAEQFEYFYVWNKGRYGVDDRFTILFN